MPFSGGVFTRLYNWVADKNANIKITASRMDAEDDGFAAALNAIVSQTQPFVQPTNVPNGAVGAPGYAFTNDTDTGFYRKSTGTIGVAGDGANKVDLTGAGVKFVDGGSTLDWFESGTWTPTIVGLSTGGTGTYSVQAGHFVRIGGWVGFVGRVVWTAHTGTGNMQMGGLPYANANAYIAPVTINAVNVTIPAASILYAQVNGSASTIQIATTPDTGGTLSDLALDTAGTIQVAGFYRVA